MTKNINDSIKDLATDTLAHYMNEFLFIIEESDDVDTFSFNSAKAMATILRELQENKDDLTSKQIDFIYMSLMLFEFASCFYMNINLNYKLNDCFYKYVFDNLMLASDMFSLKRL